VPERKTVTLAEDNLVIADDAKVLAIAGIMGGEESGVTSTSTDIMLESAFFAPAAIAGKARAWGFGSDSSFRYERGVDFELQRAAMERATELVLSICGGEAGPLNEQVGELPTRKGVKVRTARVARLLGITLSAEQISTILARLGLAFDTLEDGFLVHAPSFRYDIEIEEDLIEEVARVHGYDAIPTKHRLPACACWRCRKSVAHVKTSAISWLVATIRKWSATPLSKKPGSATSPVIPTRYA
jgi:phenylalanyl-tRNA synthetase beta chain